MNDMINIIRRFLFRYVYQQWNIAIADIGESLNPKNVKWMKHNYTDRWFADPFIIDETKDIYIVLAEEFLRDASKGHLVRLTVSKSDFKLLKNETILDLSTHLSFPNFIDVNGVRYIYPENGKSGMASYYEYGPFLHNPKVLLQHPVADAVICYIGNKYYLLYTNDFECNGNKLQVSVSDDPLSGYSHSQTIEFADNIARRAGNVFAWNGRIVSPAQVSNNDYGEALSFQELSIENEKICLKEFTRMSPPTKDYPKGFHTYNVYGDKVIIDGYRYGSNMLHTLYFSLRRFI